MWAVHVGLTEQPVHEAQSLAVEQIIYHARYRPKGLDYDIALMKLNTSLVFNGNDVVYFLTKHPESEVSFSKTHHFTLFLWSQHQTVVLLPGVKVFKYSGVKNSSGCDGGGGGVV